MLNIWDSQPLTSEYPVSRNKRCQLQVASAGVGGGGVRKLRMRVLPGCRAEASCEEEGVSQAGALLPQQTDRQAAGCPAYFLLCSERGSEG